MLVTKQFQIQLNSIEILVHTNEVRENQNCLVNNILQNIFFNILGKGRIFPQSLHEGTQYVSY